MSETKDSSDGVDDGTAISVSTDDNQTREYLRVHPSEDGLDKSAVESQFRHLHELTVSEDSSLFEELSDGSTSAVIECLLVSRDGAQTKIEYYFGVKNGRLDTLKRALRGVFPDTYELREESLCLAEVADLERSKIGDGPVLEQNRRRITGVTYNAKAKRRRDWQVGLDTETTTHPESESVDGGYSDLPLAGVLETMASTSETVIYQTLLEPMTDWTELADQRQGQLKRGRDRLLPRTIGSISTDPNIDHEMTTAEKRRHDAIEMRDAHRSFSATARAAVVTAPSNTKEGYRVAKELASAFGSIGSKSYTIEGRVVVDDNPDRFLSTSIGPPTYEEASGLYENLCNRVVHPPDTDRFTTLAPWAKNRSPGIVVDAQEAPYLCLIGGETVTAEGNRALDVTPGEQTVLPLPPDKRLAIYRDPGLTLGHPVTQDGVALDMRIAVPPETQTKNTLISGTVGSGKSMLGISGFLDNHAATDGLDVLIDPKGGEAIDQYLLAHSIQFGDLDDVYYFDCADILPAFSFFDIRPALDAGISRTTAIDNIVDQYTDILRQIMEGGNYGRAAYVFSAVLS
ncbi:hypothetical protein [Halococcus thailandensis]|uniref:Helicase HerA central domain-containing protein n=1 Tax=Halococcus thailandensis JCM 13552 TaxID=1227457 RepID=M0MRJ2_9EURY|nr:hypothetical protein [Halococcus thailandensis]EMA48246.1 hypothetical protein C451_20667 [Halococcus thailandensis JCM 13552]